MNLYTQVTTRIMKDGRPNDIWFVFETEYPTHAALSDALSRDGIVKGTRLDVRPIDGDKGRRIIVGESWQSFGKETFVSMCPLTFDLYDDEGLVCSRGEEAVA